VVLGPTPLTGEGDFEAVIVGEEVDGGGGEREV